MAQPPAGGKPEPDRNPDRDVDRTAYVRRFSLGGRISVTPLTVLKGGTGSESLPAVPSEITATAESKSRHAGAGITTQFALTDQIALGIDLIRRKVGFQETVETRTGVDNPSTTTDERKLVTTVEQTRAHVWELPIVGRYYRKNRFESGRRWFLEGGAAVRRAGGVVTFTKIDDDCCAQTPRRLSHRYTLGGVAGAGIQVADDYGIKIIPSVRYTRWLKRSLESRAARSASDQVEVLLGITF